jgi:hypothetical protein
MTDDRPTAILIRKDRGSSGRKRKVAVFVALIVGLPGIALAATYIFGAITGATSFADTTLNATITAVTGTKGTTGVDCTGVSVGADKASFVMNPKAPRLKVNSTAAPSITPGTCTINVTVSNDGTVPIGLSAAGTTLPTGWTISGPKVNIPVGLTGTLTVTVDATASAVAGPITGAISVDVA